MGPKQFWSKKWRPQKILSKSLVKIRSVTTEILLIWTNVARTNIDWRMSRWQFESFFLAKIFFFAKYLFFSKNLTTKFFLGKKSFWQIFFGNNFIFWRNFCWAKFFLTIFFLTKFLQMSLWLLVYVQDRPRNLPLKFGQNWVSNSWDIPNVDKCRQDKCCLDKCHCDSWHLLKMVQGTYL